ncbi:MAG TPA: ABC transporter permease [Chromatiales bacterium]|nr:ABC transporter permease [Thiotrichales bacterium]HIP67174.1 ABC transporter permease [Chromatiales bacterium]
MSVFSAVDFIRQHREAAQQAFRELLRRPLTTILTLLAIALALALPGMLLAILGNVQQTTKPWEDNRQINVFMKLDVTEDNLAELANEWRDDGEIKSVKMISQKQALEQFKQNSGMADALELLEVNPLPAVLIVTPNDNISDPENIKLLGKRLAANPAVDQIQLDQESLQRLQSFLNFLNTSILLLAFLFGLMVTLIIINSLRFEIIRRQNEIKVVKLVGGSNEYIQRPFLYTALLLGLMGAILAVIIIHFVFLFLAPYLESLLSLYGNTNSPLHLNPETTMTILLAALLLSLASTWVAVRFNLRQIEPQ